MGKIMAPTDQNTGSTISEKNPRCPCWNVEKVKAGDVVVCQVDFAMVTDTRIAGNALKVMKRVSSPSLKVLPVIPPWFWIITRHLRMKKLVKRIS
jgi:hypothetical protein